MAFTKFATIVFLVGFLTAQVTSIFINSAVTETTVTETSTVSTIGLAAAAFNLPPYPGGIPNYFLNGLPSYTMNYPFYSIFNNDFSTSLLSDYDVNMELARYAYKYNIPATSLLQMYNLLHDIMPTLPTQNDLNMIRAFAEAWQAEQLGYVNNYKHPLLEELYINQLSNYLPSNFPSSYLNMLGYLDSRVPRLSSSTYSAIQRAINENVSLELMNRSEYLNFAMGTAMRYMAYNYASWSIV